MGLLRSLFFILYTSGLAMAQEVPKILEFQRADYNAGHQNWMITQDCDDFIYVANTAGVLIYNGFKWQLVPLPKNENPRAVYLGKDCKVYTGAFESFGYIDLSDRNHPVYVSLADTLLENSNQEIWNIFGKENQIIFQSFSTIYIYDYHSFSRVVPPENIMLGRCINEQMYIPKIERGMYKMDSGKVEEIEEAMNLPSETKLADICASNHPEELILGTQYNGIYILKGATLREVNSELNEQFKQEQINKLLRLSSGDFVVGTILNGLYITDDFINVKYHISKSNGLSNNTVLSLYEDKNKDLWVGLDKGINLIKISDPVTYFYDRQGKLGTIFTSINYNNTLYLGTNQGVFKADPEGTFSLIDDSQGQNWSFIEVDGDLICGHNKGTYLIKNDEFIQISDITGGWCMQKIGDKKILQSTYTGLVILEKKNGRWTNPQRVENGDLLIENFVRSGQTLVGYHSYYGINVVQLSDDFKTVISKSLIKEADTYRLDKEQINLVATEQGISFLIDSSYFQLDGKSFKKLNNAMFDKLNQDEKFVRQHQFYQSISDISKLENISTYQFFKPSENDLPYILLGFDEGYLIIPENYKKTESSSSPILVDFLNVEEQTYTQTGKLIFQPYQNNVNIQLKDFSFRNHSGYLKCKLNNWGDVWFDIPEDGLLNYMKLDDGTYELMIKDYNEKPFRLLKFTIKPHWYESWIGGLVFGLMFIILVWYLDKNNKNKLKTQTEKLQREKEREVESEKMKAINDKLEREVIYKSKMLANSTLALVQKNKMLNDLKMFISKNNQNGINDPYFKQRIINLINRNINQDQDWEIFERNFAEVHEDFLEKLKMMYPDITAGELKLAAYIRMNLSSKEIAPLLNISVRSVENKRYRLRKKMQIEHDDNLSEHLLRL